MLHGATTQRTVRWRQMCIHVPELKFSTSLQSRGVFSFINDCDQDQDALVDLSRESLRYLGKHDDHVALHLPFSPSPRDYKGDLPIPSTCLPSGLDSLQKTAVVEIHNPSARNALSGKMMAQLSDAVALLENPKVHDKLNAVVLRGTGGWFCAGADLRFARQELNSPEAGAAMGALMVDTLTRFRRLPLVSFAAIEGGAFGGGAELATACDFRIIENSAVIQFVQSRMGVVPGWGGGARLYKIVGRRNALRLLCTAEKISSDRAIQLNLADEVFNVSEEDSSAAITSFMEPFDAIAPGNTATSSFATESCVS
ncbi:Ethylmalonyl-CoA decarboxylase [Phytophthora citrophthora]|uniref:Ethylmalonyl-CoA decarboxylase n=1 Tax=Phytophthora citrophthora TaxID=4793 RepID=A0AAD9LT79_9STRA|nr:Ethylmalonyl-CoA decarboxylase [Phytophthora citrophthora]